MSRPIDRRTFLGLAALSATGALATPLASASRITEADKKSLSDHMAREAANSGKGPYGELRFNGYRGLAELPWFEIDDAGVLRNVADDTPLAIDVHSHFGMSFSPAPEVDLMRKTDRVEYLLDCDATTPGCELDLDVFINTNIDADGRKRMTQELFAQFTTGSAAAATHTIPNLLAEMDATRVEYALNLPIAFGAKDDLSERWLAAIKNCGHADRFIPGASVNTNDDTWRERLGRFTEAGARVIKVHPTMQRTYPDSDALMEVYAECERLGLIVFFHCGRAGLEPEFMQQYAMPRFYEAAAKAFPKVQFIFGHGGSRDMETAIPIAKRNDNVWLGTHGQGVTALDEMLKKTGGERMLFGSDWPWYHLAASLAKLLIITEGQPQKRHALLRGNAEKLFGIS